MHCPDIRELPASPSGKNGWPWNEQPGWLADPKLADRPCPRISIITPSYNQANFLEHTIRSVLLQGYPNLEYIIIDGGSTDGSLEIIQKYEAWLTYWVSEPDSGQSQAINKGWVKADGEIIAYINSDDYYLPGAFTKVVEAFSCEADTGAVVGAVVTLDEEHSELRHTYLPKLPAAGPVDLTLWDHESWLLPQQSAFFSAGTLDIVGRFLREELHYTMDRELFYRVCSRAKLRLIQDELAVYRFHSGSKSISKMVAMYQEAPKAIAYHLDGSRLDQQRKKVGKWRIAQGHYRYASQSHSFFRALPHYLLAAYYRKGYLKRRSYQRSILQKAGLFPLISLAKRKSHS